MPCHSVNIGRILSEYELVPSRFQRFSIICAGIITVSAYNRKDVVQSGLSATNLPPLQHQGKIGDRFGETYDVTKKMAVIEGKMLETTACILARASEPMQLKGKQLGGKESQGRLLLPSNPYAACYTWLFSH